MNSRYLGDGLYARWDGYMLTLRADANVVYLEPEVLTALLKFWRSTDAGRNVKTCPICDTELETRDVCEPPDDDR